jgi:hypothetical protein
VSSSAATSPVTRWPSLPHANAVLGAIAVERKNPTAAAWQIIRSSEITGDILFLKFFMV